MCGASICGTYRQRCGSKWRQRFTPASASAFSVRRRSSGYCTQGTAESAPATRSSRGSRRSDDTRDRRGLSRDMSSGCSEGLALGDRVHIVDATQSEAQSGKSLRGLRASWQLVQHSRPDRTAHHRPSASRHQSDPIADRSRARVECRLRTSALTNHASSTR